MMDECQLAHLPIIMTGTFSPSQHQLSALIYVPFALRMKLPDRFLWGKEKKMTDAPSNTLQCHKGGVFLCVHHL